MNITREKILDILPHRQPFLFPHEVNIIEPGKQGMGFVDFSSVELVWSGIGEQPDPWQEYSLESAAQIFGIVLASEDMSKKKGEDEKHLLLAFNNVEFLRDIDPKNILSISLSLTQTFGRMFRADIICEQQDHVMMTGSVSVMKS